MIGSQSRRGKLIKWAVAMVLATQSLAFTAVHAAEVWHTSTLKYVYPQADGSFVLIFDESAAQCSNANGYYYVAVGQNGVAEEGKRMMYAAALAAKVSGSRFTIAFDDSTHGVT